MERAKDAYPLLDCLDLSEREFLLWYDLQASNGIHLGMNSSRMRYASSHVPACVVCSRRYANMMRADSFFEQPATVQ